MLRLAIALIILEAVFLVLQRSRPALSRGFQRFGPGTDVVYWFAGPLVIHPLTMAAVYLALLPALMLLGVSARDGYAGFGPVAALPAWLQALAMVVVGDFVGYWIHRWFHAGSLWPFHAVHHSSSQVDWLSSVRLHPVNEFVTRVAQGLTLLLLGFAPGVLAAYLPLLTFYALFVHAELPWDFGPLRMVLASPTFHRWHHATDPEALDKNFAGLLPVWDLLFGTLYLPAGQQPTRFGVVGNPLPESFIGLTIYPFRRQPASA